MFPTSFASLHLGTLSRTTVYNAHESFKSTFKQPIIYTTRLGTALAYYSKDLSELNIPPKASIAMCCVYSPRSLGLPGRRQLRNLLNTTLGLKREYTGKLWKAFLPIPPGTL